MKNNVGKCKKIRKLVTSQGDDHTIGCLLDYQNSKENYKLIPIDLTAST